MRGNNRTPRSINPQGLKVQTLSHNSVFKCSLIESGFINA